MPSLRSTGVSLSTGGTFSLGHRPPCTSPALVGAQHAECTMSLNVGVRDCACPSYVVPGDRRTPTEVCASEVGACSISYTVTTSMHDVGGDLPQAMGIFGPGFLSAHSTPCYPRERFHESLITSQVQGSTLQFRVPHDYIPMHTHSYTNMHSSIHTYFNTHISTYTNNTGKVFVFYF